MTSKEYFKFTCLGVGFAPFSTWQYMTFKDGTKWYKLLLGLYVQVK